MSMYWSGYEVLCLVLTEKEDIDYFRKKYVELNENEFPGMTEEEALESLDDALNCGEPLTWSKDAGSDGGKEFYTKLLTDDLAEGLFFNPANPNSGMNWRQVYPDVLAIAAEVQPCTRELLKNRFYESFDKLIEEFQEKCGKYLPKNFEYENVIGDLSFAIYA